MKPTQTTFSNWSTTELQEWIEAFSLYSFLNINNANTYIQALKELSNRKGDIFES